MKRILAALALLTITSCSSLGGSGDECTTAEDCELGLRCIAGECSSSTITCGEGTVEQNGVCRYTPLRCGSGTMENEEGQCVPEPAE